MIVIAVAVGIFAFVVKHTVKTVTQPHVFMLVVKLKTTAVDAHYSAANSTLVIDNGFSVIDVWTAIVHANPANNHCQFCTMQLAVS